jgi:hypothetical protein
MEIAKWYNMQIPGLSKRFEASLHTSIKKPSVNPYAFLTTNYKCR